MDISERVAGERKRLGLTQVELAKRAGCHPMQISKIERGVANLGESMAERLTQALGVREAWLRFGLGRKSL